MSTRHTGVCWCLRHLDVRLALGSNVGVRCGALNWPVSLLPAAAPLPLQLLLLLRMGTALPCVCVAAHHALPAQAHPVLPLPACLGAARGPGSGQAWC